MTPRPLTQQERTPPAGSDPTFCRRMARFEIGQARKRTAQGKPDRAAVALLRARIWRAWAAAGAMAT